MISVAVAVALAFSGSRISAKQPAWLDFTIASYILRYDDKHEVMAVHDKATGYYLVRTVECDGGTVTLTLTRDSSEVEESGFDTKHDRNGDYKPCIEKPLPSLITGRGVMIGDTPTTVRKRLGEPTTTDAQTLTYAWKAKIDGNDGEYDNIYTFKHGKLIEITFCRDNGVG